MALGETDKSWRVLKWVKSSSRCSWIKRLGAMQTLTNEQLVQWAQMLNARVPKPNPTPTPPNADAFREEPGGAAEPVR